MYKKQLKNNTFYVYDTVKMKTTTANLPIFNPSLNQVIFMINV